MGVQIEFGQFDKNYKIIEEKTKKVSKFIYENRNYVSLLKSIIFNNSQWTSDTINKIEKSLKFSKKIYLNKGESEENYSNFYILITNLYKIVNIPNIIQTLKAGKIIFEYSQQAVLDLIRGKLFEELCILILKERFKNSPYYIGCDIYINGNKIVTNCTENAKTKHSVDFVGEVQKHKCYEIYEFKIQPKGFTYDNYQHFKNIYCTFKQNDIKCELFCLVFEYSEYVRTQIESYYERDHGDNLDYSVIGGDNLFDLELSVAS